MSIGTPRRPARFLTKRFSGTSCTAIERVKLSTPALAVVYAVASLRPQCPEVEAMLMILPLRFWSIITWAAARVQYQTLRRQTFIVRSHSSSVISKIVLWSVHAALLTRMSTPPNCFTTACTMLSTEDADETSQTTAIALPAFLALISSATRLLLP